MLFRSERKDWGGAQGHSTFYLKKGRLRVYVMVDSRAAHLLQVPVVRIEGAGQ